MWEIITNIILVLSILTFATFVALGIYQWIKRGSIKKVDQQILWIPLPMVLMTIVYFLFDKVWILNTRPIDPSVPSFPSSHVMVVATIFFIASMLLSKYIKSEPARITLWIVMTILISLTCIGRVVSGMHWPIDVIGGLIFAFIFSEIYYQCVKKGKKKHVKHLHKDH